MPKYEITHKILRAEYLTLTIEAENDEDAKVKGLEAVNHVSTADYEPGDVEEDSNDVDIRQVDDDAELSEWD